MFLRQSTLAVAAVIALSAAAATTQVFAADESVAPPTAFVNDALQTVWAWMPSAGFGCTVALADKAH